MSEHEKEKKKSLGLRELDDVFEDLITLLKNAEVGAELTDAGVNTSLAITAAEGLLAYIQGEKQRAADDLGTVAEEIASRLARSEEELDGRERDVGSKEKPS